MALPAGVSTATLTVGVPVNFSGAPLKSYISIKPSVSLVHTATGTPLVNLIDRLETTEGAAGQFALPHTDQDGFQDENGNAYKNWYYTATIQYAGTRETLPETTKTFQLLVGQTTVDLDLLPSGVPAMPWTGATAGVTSVNGQTGAANLTKSNLGLSNVDNTSDASKPLSAAQVAGLAGKMDRLVPIVAKSAGTLAKAITYGHSFLAEQGLTDVTKYWARQLTSAFGITYPTSDGGATDDLKRAVGGSTIEAVAARVLGNPTLYAAPNTKALFVLETMLNSARWLGADAVAITSATNSARAIMAAINASERIEDSDARITYSGAFTQQTGISWASGGSYKWHNSVGQYLEFTAPLEDSYVVIVGKQGTGQTLVTVSDRTAVGTPTLASLDMSNQAVTPPAGSQPQVPYAYRIPSSARGHVVRFALTGGTSLSFDVILRQSVAPPPVLWMKEPYLANYAASVSFPNGSDAAIDAFNNIIDVMAAEFPNIIVADPNKPGYWDKTKHVQADEVHPNDAGNDALARAAFDAVRAWQARNDMGLVETVRVITSPNGTRFRVSVDDDGALTTTSL